MPPVDFKDRYKTSIIYALAGFQMIEEGLKTYLSFYYDAVRELLPYGMAYNYSRADVEDAALGQLLTAFSRTTSNTGLLSALRKLQKDRNLIAHRALLDLFREDDDSPKMKSEARRMMDLASKTNELSRQLQQECLNVLAAKQTGLARRQPA